MKPLQNTTPIAPGATIGLLGGGQLARMTALAARDMGYRIALLDPDPRCAAAPLADLVIAAPFDDADAARRLARQSDVVTYEIERIAPEVLHAVAESGLLRPGAEVLLRIQDRGRQKRWLASKGYPLGPWRPVESAKDLEAALTELGPCRAKRCFGGYDGRSQLRVTGPSEADHAFDQLGGSSVAEQDLQLALELSVMVARTPEGHAVAHPPALNWHEDAVLSRTLFPAPISPVLARQATDLAQSLAAEMEVQGLLVVELFVTAAGELLVNELAPRPHNTFHGVGAACATGQFEQYVRAICGLPLGAVEPHGASVLVNLLGDLWTDQPPRFDTVLRIPGVSVHLYGKEPRPKRKVGHLVARASSGAVALARAEAAEKALGLGPAEQAAM